MRTTHKLAMAASLVIATLPLSIPSAQATIDIGVMAPRGPMKAMKRWIEYGRYMSKALGEKVRITPLSPPNMMPVAKQGSVDFTLANPTMAVILQEAYGAKPMATLKKKNGSYFAGVIVAKKGNGITKSEHLRGKRVMALKFRRAAGAYTFQTYHLKQKGIDPHKDFSSFTEGKRQDELILAVGKGKIDAAFVRSGMLENMSKEGKINLDDFVIVDQRTDKSVPQLHTTELYPEWYLSAMKGTDPAVAKRVAKASLALQAKTKAAKRAKIKGFVKPVPMDNMKTALKALKIKPYDK